MVSALVVLSAAENTANENKFQYYTSQCYKIEIKNVKFVNPNLLIPISTNAIMV